MLKIVSPAEFRDGAFYARVRCKCGVTFDAKTADVRKRRVRYCRACVRKQRCNPLFRLWRSLRNRGVDLCDSWRADFTTFIAQIPPRPEGDYCLCRRDTNHQFAPDNVVWKSRVEMSRDRPSSIVLEHNGESLAKSQWARRLGMSPTKLTRLLKTKTLAEIMQ